MSNAKSSLNIEELLKEVPGAPLVPYDTRLRPCTKCKVPTLNLRACANCKAVKYCSRQCQKDDWPEHKAICDKAAKLGLTSICRFMDRLIVQSFFMPYLQMAIMHSILDSNSRPSLETVFKVRFFIGLEPVDIHNFEEIMLSPTFAESGDCPLGMLQVLYAVVDSKYPVNATPGSNSARLRNSFDSQGWFGLGMAQVELVYGRPAGTGEAVQFYTNDQVCPFMPLLASFSAGEVVTIPSVSGEGIGVKKPRTVASCLEFINMHIRQDHGNKYHLRRKMQREDMKMIHWAVRPNHLDTTGDYGLAWVAKILGEDVYSANAIDLRSYARAHRSRRSRT